MTIAIHHGDCLEVIPRLVADGIECDAVVTDPPYGLEFMGQEWDKLDGGLPQETVWKGRRGKGGSSIGTDDKTPASRHHIGFGSARQGFKRCTRCGKRAFSGSPCRCDDPTWVTEYPEGPPSSAIRMQRWHEAWAREAYTILRPGGFLVAFGGTRTYHRLVCAIEDAGFVIQDTIAWLYGSGFPKNKAHLKPAHEPICLAYKPGGKRTMQVDECRIGTGGEFITAGHADTVRRGGLSQHEGWDRPSHSTEGEAQRRERALEAANTLGRWPANVAHDGSDEVLAAFPDALGSHDQMASISDNSWFTAGGKYKGAGNNDKGSAARFFYTAKADKQDRWGSRHPTVKPVDLIRWLVRLVTPPGGLVLDPFAGSGTTGAAAFAEGRNGILIEREDQYVADIRERMGWCEGGGMHSTAAKARRTEDKPLGGLFDMAPT